MLFFRLGPYQQLHQCSSVKSLLGRDPRLSKVLHALDTAQLAGGLQELQASLTVNLYHVLDVTWQKREFDPPL